jgi:S-adenosylmethionine-dependent methyltransferase
MLLRFARRLLYPRVPRHVAARRRSASEAGMAAFEAALRRHLFPAGDGGELTSQDREDFETHRVRRLEMDRQVFVPWLDAVRRLEGARVLEIGCGTGSSTVALAEQGAEVVGLDVDEGALAVARARCEAFGVSAELLAANAVEAPQRLPGRLFDLILFFASLEHMTHRERLESLAGAWGMLHSGQLLGVVETPNRLWYIDNHTSLLPFFLWLPDDLALDYAGRSPRESLRHQVANSVEAGMLEFLRQGRGVSYHEFELALGIPAEKLPVASSLATHYRHLETLRLLRRPRPLDTRFHLLLRKIHPRVHRAFFHPSLDLILRKP